ncbi:MAG: DUF1572 domain-containing protein [Planctomycetes bacterium]|nr:DUF1572 domain-containing protein [Planctomycetota bacterium]
MIQELLFELRRTKKLGDRALDQVSEVDWHWRPDAESNSVAILVQHLHGNMLSRWTDFLTTDGEKASRDRDAEFDPQALAASELRERWEEAWRVCLGAVGALGDADLGRTVRIRGEPLTVLDAILRQVSHYAYHVGQIVQLARSRRGTLWQSLSIPKGMSKEHREGRYKRP